MTASPYRSFIARLTGLLDGLSPAEKRFAEILLEFPGDLPTHTASELARKCQISNATVTRLVRRLGYASYNEARRQVRFEQQVGSPLIVPSTTASTNQSLQVYLDQWVANLTRTCSPFNDELLSRIASEIAGAETAWFAGYRANYCFAAYFRWQLFRVLRNAVALPGPGETLAEYAAGMGDKDVLVVFALRRTVTASRALLRFAAKAKTKTLCVTDLETEDTGPATWLLRCHTKASGPFDSHVAVMAVIHLLANRTLELSGKAGRRRMSRIENAYDALDTVS